MTPLALRLASLSSLLALAAACASPTEPAPESTADSTQAILTPIGGTVIGGGGGTKTMCPPGTHLECGMETPTACNLPHCVPNTPVTTPPAPRCGIAGSACCPPPPSLPDFPGSCVDSYDTCVEGTCVPCGTAGLIACGGTKCFDGIVVGGKCAPCESVALSNLQGGYTGGNVALGATSTMNVSYSVSPSVPVDVQLYDGATFLTQQTGKGTSATLPFSGIPTGAGGSPGETITIEAFPWDGANSCPKQTVTMTMPARDAQGVTSGCSPSVHFTNHGDGPSQGTVTIVPIFWGYQPDGNYWSQIDAAYTRLEQSQYYAWIRREYGAPALKHTFPAFVAPLQIWAGNMKESDVQDELDGLIRSNAVATPDNALYVVHLAPYATVTKGNGDHICDKILAFNGFFTTHTILPPTVNNREWAVIPDQGTCTGLDFDGVTRILSHEIIENVTNPDGSGSGGTILGLNAGGNGWFDPAQPDGCDQIGDLCNGEATTIQSTVGDATGRKTMVVQKMWSNALNACVTEDQVGALLQ
ncbi:MAG TPA: hypothetical protein VGI39_20665 [Polyangiaceae bacterium]|jgi:hypothetical protein